MHPAVAPGGVTTHFFHFHRAPIRLNKTVAMKSTTKTVESSGGNKPAAVYVRMSTEHQQYSTNNQMDVILGYAHLRSMEIVREYSDEGKSGLNIAGRDALARMIDDVRSGEAPFLCILVYDVSRWGRFQDADESAYYEFICRRAGIDVHYCAEQFENDGSPISTIVKGVKRAMAGEYSRELSAKVFQGACRLIRLGYKQGGVAGYGLRRMLVDQTGQPKGVLALGEQKSIQTDRVVLVPGPDNEVADVRWMFQVFVKDGLTESEIARLLNCRGVKTDFNRDWTRGTVHQVLTNEKYIGNNVYHRTSFKLKRKHIKNDPADWVRAEGAWAPVVEPEMFHRAQGIILERSRRISNEEMLDRLKSLLSLHGRLSGILIDEREDLPSSAAFRHRFGSLVRAYSLIGYTPTIDYGFIEDNRSIRRKHPEIVGEVVHALEEAGATVECDPDTDLLRINDEFTISIVLCRHTATSAGSSRWAIRMDTGLQPDITIAVRMEAGNHSIRDYYLLPSLDMTWERLRMREANGVELDGYQYDNLRFLFRMAERILIEEPS
jgi:DNA invertase Pin-like site-specific DNA recombinase